MLYADQVIISNQPSKDAVPSLLYGSDIGKHTSVVHLDNHGKSGDLKATRYVWGSERYRPNMFSYPLACPVCHCIASWQNVGHQPNDGSTFTLVYKTKLGENKIPCKGTYVVPAAPPSSPVKFLYSGTWLATV
jgi:hypothetical protein